MMPPPFDVPVDPDAAQAQQWIITELAKPQYQAAQPTWFDRLSAAFWEWVKSLTVGVGGPFQAPVLAGAAVVVLAVVVVAFLIFGVPRLNRRSAVTGALFGVGDDRDAAAMRRAANAAAEQHDWTPAIEEMFRSIARGLAERTILTTTPGTTAHDFAARAGAIFAPLAGALAATAAVFDQVRYLDGEGTEADYRRAAELEAELRATRPPALSAVGAAR
ncbi:MAG TPA: hypothetical protein DCP11_14895 [Microbacteriaceae bacterium]|jgi:hypothetical protein|nr:hypothetical protein [Microbacteriaceae bacterium]